MNAFVSYLSTVPVIFAIWLTFTAGLIIEINRLFPDSLIFYFNL
uniref:Photosystem I reaction center subunit IX n=1 Tax=Gymnochlora stellata TaxID=67809 RepID=A0A140JZI3_GYMST|nr:photosystem I protein J [Gymnochlora stellata]BAU62510.1 photosystem I protein J [Gymnochlora stellata]